MRTTRNLGNDRGAILVHMVFALIALMTVSTFVIDYGTLWASRRQAQNAADSGAIAGATALALDDTTDATGIVKHSAFEASQANLIWGKAGSTNIDGDIFSPATGFKCPDDASSKCVRVDVYRSAARGNALPTFFGYLLGFSGQDIKATATAKATVADATDCLRPFAVPDKWIDTNGDGIFDGSDQYVPPTSAETTGYTTDDIGTFIEFKGKPGDPPTLDNGWYRLLDLYPGNGGGANETRKAIATCSGTVYKIGDELTSQQGEEEGSRDALWDIYQLDPDASWDTFNKVVKDSCAAKGTCNKYVSDGSKNGFVQVPDPTAAASPRIIDLPVFDPQKQQQDPGQPLVMTNIWAFFIDTCDHSKPTSKNDFKLVCGYLAFKPDLIAGGGELDPSASFIKSVMLIR